MTVDDFLNDLRSAHLPPPAERRRVREAAGVSMRELAAALGVTHGSVRNWETTTKKPRLRVRREYARLLRELDAIAKDGNA